MENLDTKKSAGLRSLTPSTRQARRFDETRKKPRKLSLEEPCKDVCRSIRRQSRSKLPRTQRVRGTITNTNGRKRRFGRMCKKTCMTKAKEKIRRSISQMNGGRKEEM